jgi:hypothetical protein
MYKVFQVEGGFQIFQVEGDQKRPLDGGTVYPFRQGAYRRCKELNEGRKSKMQQEIKVKIEAMRGDCKALIKRIEEDFGGIEVLVIDPLYSDNHRFIQFARKIRMSEDEPEDDQLWQPWMRRSPMRSEVLTKLAKYRDLDEVLHVSCKVGNDVYEGSEIR